MVYVKVVFSLLLYLMFLPTCLLMNIEHPVLEDIY